MPKAAYMSDSAEIRDLRVYCVIRPAYMSRPKRTATLLSIGNSDHCTPSSFVCTAECLYKGRMSPLGAARHLGHFDPHHESESAHDVLAHGSQCCKRIVLRIIGVAAEARAHFWEAIVHNHIHLSRMRTLQIIPLNRDVSSVLDFGLFNSSSHKTRLIAQE